MRSWKPLLKIAGIYLLIFGAFLFVPLWLNRTLTASSDSLNTHTTVIIDAGHGGEDGGAISCTGKYESHINLQIALRLEDMMHLLGLQTIMIRSDDRSIYTNGTSIATRKISDIKERVRIVNHTPNALYISIHQNHFANPKYYGAQVFYNPYADSKLFATQLQSALKSSLDPMNRRKTKQSNGVYIMEHIACTGVLVECGFLSNPQEEQLLTTEEYQKKIAATIAAATSQYLNT